MGANYQRFGQPAPPRDTQPHDGVLLVDKPAGPTSHDVVHRIRRHFGIKKVGHGGTLDPNATGLLIILTGRGTKLSDRFLGSDKTYTGTLELGKTTSTQDADGELVSEGDSSCVTEEQLLAAMKALTGDSMQTPPMVSAIKVDGVPLYKHARKGKTVERKARLIHVYEFRLLQFRPPSADFLVRCTKGTYVRTLCADVGESLGCGAFLSALRRTRCGDLTIGNALPLDRILQMDLDELYGHIIPIGRFR